VATDCFVTIESTAEGRAGYFFDYSQTAEKQLLSGTPLGKLDWKFFFFSWWKNKAYWLDQTEAIIPQRLNDYFNELFAKHGIDTNPGQRAWYAAKEKTLGGDMKREYPSLPAEAFQQSIEGAYYAKQFTKLYAAQTPLPPPKCLSARNPHHRKSTEYSPTCWWSRSDRTSMLMRRRGQVSSLSSAQRSAWSVTKH
jgi:hypothetical protein